MWISASQISTFTACNKKWWWDKIARVPRKSNAAAEEGTRIHALFENTVKQGQVFYAAQTDEDKNYIDRVFRLLPDDVVPVPEYLERSFRFSLWGHEWIGRVDIDAPRHVLDIKTTASVRMLASSEELLSSAPQTIIYGTDYFMRNPDDEDVDIDYLYVERRPYADAKDERRTVQLTQEAAIFGMEMLLTVAEQMEVVKVTPQHDVPMNTDHCKAYGGCPYADNCFPTKDENVINKFFGR